MTKKESIFSQFSSSHGLTASAIGKNPWVFYPFLIFAGIELLSLIFFYLCPREPLRGFMGPIITTFWGEQFLHYPTNFLLLPKLAALARMNLAIFIGSFLSGLAVAFLYKVPVAKVLQKYISLLFIVFILTFLFFVMYKLSSLGLTKYFAAGNEKLLFLGPGVWMGMILSLASQVFALILQMLLAYAIPVLLTTDKKFIGAIGGSLKFFFSHKRVTLLLVGIPMLIALPLIVLNYFGAYLMVKIAPEVILWLGILGIVVNSLIIDPLVTLTTAAFYSQKKENT